MLTVDHETRERMAQILLERGRKDTAGEVLDRLLALVPDDPRLGMGGNQPPEPITDTVDPEHLVVVPTAELAPLFDREYAPLTERAEEFEADLEQWLVDHKNGAVPIADAAENERLSDFMVQLRDFVGDEGEVETTRRKVKRSVYEAGQAIDAWFGTKRQTILNVLGVRQRGQPLPMGTLLYAQDEFMRREADRQAAEQRRIAETAAEEARKRAQEARRLAALEKEAEDKEAAQAATDAAVEAAEEAEVRATQMQQTSSAGLPVRTRSALGTTTSMRSTWSAQVTDIKALCRAVAEGIAPVTFVTVLQGNIDRAVRDKSTPLRECPGLRIFEERTAIRRAAR